MPISTYTDLQATIADFLNRGDLTAIIPTFVSLAEADLVRDLRTSDMETRSTTLLDSQYTGVPSDWLETIRFYVTSDGSNPLELLSQAELLDRRMQTRGGTGRPRFYVMTGRQFEVYPTPNAAYDAELLYYAKPPALSAGNPTNWLLTKHPDIYLYGSLMQSAPYLQDDARVALWAGLYKQALSAANIASARAQTSGRGLRMKIRSY